MTDNQIREELFILPDDYEEQADTTIEAEPVQSEGKEPEQLFKLEDREIKYNKENKRLKDFSPDDVVTYVQKGMNYDKVDSRAKELQAQVERLQRFESIAQTYGYDVEGLQSALMDNHFQALAEQNGSTAELERRAYEIDMKAKAIADKEASDNQRVEETKQLERFLSENPDVNPQDIPQEVLEAVAKGESINTAYKDYKYNQLKSEVDRLKQLTSNIQSAPVRGTSGNGGDKDAQMDDFERGLFGSRY
jgi:hypothetical protein